MPGSVLRLAKLCAVVCMGMLAATAQGQIRVATWNLTDYGGQMDRTPAFRTVIFDEFEGRSLRPDVFAVQEVMNLGGNNTFLIRVLNEAPGSPADYVSAPFVPSAGGGLAPALFYRSSKIELLETVVVSGGVRNIMRYRMRLADRDGDGTAFYLYNVHLKAGNTTVDQTIRFQEAQAIRANAAALPEGSMYMIVGDLNVYTSAETAYTELTRSTPSPAGRVQDPANRAGAWHINFSFRVMHTQSPLGAFGGMDDRFDQLLLSPNLLGGNGLGYIGNHLAAFSTSNWNDPNHSYRTWGNDGTSFNTTLNVATNSMVGPVIAQAILDHAAGLSAPHIPVYLELWVPAKVEAPESVDFGTVSLGGEASTTIEILNGVDVATFSRSGDGAGIRNLGYTLSITGDFSLVGGTGPFIVGPGAAAGEHGVVMDTGSAGAKAGELTITSNDPDAPVVVVALSGTVEEAGTPCVADFDGSGGVTVDDIFAFLSAWFASDPSADVDGSGSVTVDDIFVFLSAWFEGCD